MNFVLIKTLSIYIHSPFTPNQNGIIEVSHKEIRKHSNNFNLQKYLHEVIDTSNNKLHTLTECMPIDLINIKDEDLINSVISKIKKNDNKKLGEYQELEEALLY